MDIASWPIGIWITISSGLVGAGFAYNGYRASMIGLFEARIAELEKENKRCKDDVQRLRGDRDYLWEELRKLRETVRTTSQFPSP